MRLNILTSDTARAAGRRMPFSLFTCPAAGRPAPKIPFFRALATVRPALAVALVCGALALSGCRGDDPDSDYRYHTAQWVVVNGTGDSYLRIVAPPRGYFHPNWDYSYGNGGYTAMAWTLDEVTDPDEAVPFERLLDCWRGWSEANIALELQWVDGTPIKLWRHADRDGEGRQFFDPSLWHHTATRHGHEVRDVWTFTILPEDIK